MTKFKNLQHILVSLSFLVVGGLAVHKSFGIPNPYQWFGLSVLWFVFAGVAYWKSRGVMTRTEFFLFYIATVSLPIAQIQTLGIFGRGSLHWVNYTEHFAIACVFTFILCPFLKQYLADTAPFQRLLLIVGAVFVIGLGYEILDFVYRFFGEGMAGTAIYSYWNDAVIDIFMEILGATTGAFMLEFVIPSFKKEGLY